MYLPHYSLLNAVFVSEEIYKVHRTTEILLLENTGRYRNLQGSINAIMQTIAR